MTSPARIVSLGEVLWDLLPAGKQLGGAPANFAFHSGELGATSRIITRVGHDALGQEILDRFTALGLATDTVQIDPEAATGTVDVTLHPGGQPSYTIREGVAWDRIEVTSLARELVAQADALCFGSLAQRSEPSRTALRSLIALSSRSTLRVFDVNLRPPFVDPGVIAGSLELANALKLNDQELPLVAQQFGLPTDSARAAIVGLVQRFDLTLVALTRGDRGSLLWAEGDWSDHPGCPTTVVDTVGAGDAFTAALVVGWLAGHHLEALNAHANAVAAFVCSQAGGTPRLPEELKQR